MKPADEMINQQAHEYIESNHPDCIGQRPLQILMYEKLHMAYVKSAQWAISLQPEWVSVKERLPERQQRVMFVVESKNDWYNGKVYGGVYTDPEFATPGICFGATHWMPLPDAPQPPTT